MDSTACSCKQCDQVDAPEMHEICPCEDCHDYGAHETRARWLEYCLGCRQDEVVDANGGYL